MGYLIVLLSVLLFVIYRKTEKYNSIDGVLIFLIFIALLLIRAQQHHLPSRLLIESTLYISGVLTFVFLFVSILFLLLTKPKRTKKVNFMYVVSLFIAYIPFGFMQQLFFYYVFLETIFHLTSNTLLSVIAGSLFYSLFHINKTLLFTLGTFAAGFFWSYVYLKFGNIIWPSLALAMVGAIYYPLYEKKNAIERRVKF